jgi:ABC-type sugar transport system substrate-binding protein
MTRLAFGIAATAFLSAQAANAQTVALVTINQQALFFNQINDGAKQGIATSGQRPAGRALRGPVRLHADGSRLPGG